VDVDRRGEGRDRLEAALRALGGIPDGALTAPWRWRGREGHVRGGFYRCFELIEQAIVAVESGTGRRPEAARILAFTAAARWDLHGLLLPLADALLDADPGAGEWTLRAALGHVINVQERYYRSTADAIERGPRGEPFKPPPGGSAPPSPEPAGHAVGSIVEVRRRVDEGVDEAIDKLGGVDDPRALGGEANWAGWAVDARFRLYRMSAHVREHTIQVEKTLALLGHVPREVDRLVRLIAAAYGRLEGACLGLDRTPAAADEALGALEVHARELAAAGR
jgi:hypothetical protein